MFYRTSLTHLDKMKPMANWGGFFSFLVTGEKNYWHLLKSTSVAQWRTNNSWYRGPHPGTPQKKVREAPYTVRSRKQLEREHFPINRWLQVCLRSTGDRQGQAVSPDPSYTHVCLAQTLLCPTARTGVLNLYVTTPSEVPYQIFTLQVLTVTEL